MGGIVPPRVTGLLSQGEIRVLRYLPTKLSAPEIADQLYLSVNTVKTHMRHLYDKLGAHRRHEAVEQARALACWHPRREGANQNKPSAAPSEPPASRVTGANHPPV
jgi:DNA-binding CsgD family transcriptional regulator